MAQVKDHTAPALLLEELEPVLDDEDDKQAEKFVMKLWRMLIYEVSIYGACSTMYVCIDGLHRNK